MVDFEDMYPEPEPEPDVENVEVGPYVPPADMPLLEFKAPHSLAPPVVPVVQKRSQELVTHNTMRESEERLMRASVGILEAALDWPKVAQLKEPPEAWVAEMGEAAAWERFTVAQSALMSKARAPVGLELASKTALGILKIRGGDQERDRPLNLNVIEIQMIEPPTFPKVVETQGE